MTSNDGTSDKYFLQKPAIAIEPVPPITPEAIKEKLAALSDEIKTLSWDNLEGAEEDVRRIKELLEEIDADLVGAWHRRLFSGEPMPGATMETWTLAAVKPYAFIQHDYEDIDGIKRVTDQILADGHYPKDFVFEEFDHIPYYLICTSTAKIAKAAASRDKNLLVTVAIPKK